MGEFGQLLKTVEGKRDALWEDLHTVHCTMELPMARWADSVCVCVCYNNTYERPLTLSMHRLNGISITMSKGVK